jgi:hypothetical protein
MDIAYRSSPDSVEAGAPVEEIRVTPAMIEAGSRAYGRWDCGGDLIEWILDDAFGAMARAADLKVAADT